MRTLSWRASGCCKIAFEKSLSLVVVSCDRYYVVSQPLKKRISKQNAQFVILATYVLAACVALPIAFRTKFVEVLYEGQFVGICTEIWSSSQSKTVYTISLLLLHFIIPLMIMTVSNIHIVHILWTKKIPGEPDEKRDRRVAGSKRKSVKILVSMVIIFAVAWLPMEVLTLIGVTDYALLDNKVSYLLWTFSQWWTFINCVSSPLLYFCFIKRYRKTFKEIFAKARGIRLLELVCCVRKSSVHSKEVDIFL
ncbi:RYamide receptor-like [Mytilus trossulus]|uniref:RYamide receptor-like n=1 Tax=Mytilus trossulus TaxID=6551 RepID=UPI003003E2E8